MKKTLTVSAAILSLTTIHSTHAQTAESPSTPITAFPWTASDAASVAPALDRFAEATLGGDLWKRPDLSMRDRCLVTLTILIARNQPGEQAKYLRLALDSGVKPREVSEIITHLAFYTGWANAMAAVNVAKDIFKERGIGVDQLPSATPELLPLDRASENRREVSVQEITGPASPGLVYFTRETLFQNLWLRPDLKPRDRSLVTVSALLASGLTGQIVIASN